MKVRLAKKEDVERMMELVDAAKEYFREAGINQWQSGYPNAPQLLGDIERGESYVLEDDGIVEGTCMISFSPDPNYEVIEGGKWLNDEPYGVIHRICVNSDKKGHGLAGFLFDEAERLAIQKDIHNLRVDTHALNIAMQHCVAKKNYVFCGVVTVADGGLRNAYQKVLK